MGLTVILILRIYFKGMCFKYLLIGCSCTWILAKEARKDGGSVAEIRHTEGV